MPPFVLIDKDKPDLVKKLMVKAAIVKPKEIRTFEVNLFGFYEREKVCINNKFETEYDSLIQSLKM